MNKQDLNELLNMFHYIVKGIEQDLNESEADPDNRIISALCGFENRLRDLAGASDREGN